MTYYAFRWLFTHTINGTGVMTTGSWGVAEIQFWTDRDTWANFGVELTSNGKLIEPGIQRL
jgi:hypothetical protein